MLQCVATKAGITTILFAYLHTTIICATNMILREHIKYEQSCRKQGIDIIYVKPQFMTLSVNARVSPNFQVKFDYNNTNYNKTASHIPPRFQRRTHLYNFTEYKAINN